MVECTAGKNRLALGIDQMVMLLAGEESIHDTIAFPNTAQLRGL